MSNEIEKLVKELGDTFELFRRENDARIEAVEKGDLNAVLKSNVDALEQRMVEMKDTIDALEKAKARPEVSKEFKSREEEAHFKAFDAFIRNPRDHETINELRSAQRELDASRPEGKKAVNITTNAEGGYALPEVIDTAISNNLIDFSPMRQEASVVPVGTSDWKTLVNKRGAAYGWVGEGDTRTATAESQFGEVAPTFGTVYAYPQASEESLNDLFFDVANWIVEESMSALAEGEGNAFTVGNGTKKPTGLMAATTAATGDSDSPARAFATVEHVPTGIAAAFPQDRMGSPAGNPADVLIDVTMKLKAGYRANAKFMMNKATLNVVRKWKDANGNYIWQPALMAGQPSILCGYPVVENEEMADIGANALPIAFGDFRQAYVVADLMGTKVTVDEITTVGYTKYYVRKRVGGMLKKDEAVKFIKVATS